MATEQIPLPPLVRRLTAVDLDRAMEIEEAASNFYTYLMAAKNFEGEEVITFPRPD